MQWCAVGCASVPHAASPSVQLDEPARLSVEPPLLGAGQSYLVQVIDLGQAASLLLDAGVKVLVNAGASDDARNTDSYSESHLVLYLAAALGAPSSQRCTDQNAAANTTPSRPSIDHVFVTALDPLHANQLDELLECFDVKNIWLPRLSGREERSAVRFLLEAWKYPALSLHVPSVPPPEVLEKLGISE
ncbi:MAG: hypothetical protein QM756_36465 [Polyangiaceae bacterium]